MEASVSLYTGITPKASCNIYGIQGAGETNVPEPVRTVPIHPADTKADPDNNGPISQKDNKTEPLFTFASLELGLKISSSKKESNEGLTLRTGVGADFGVITGSHLNERNYTDAPGTETKDYGAALTYYYLGATGLVYPKIFGELSGEYWLARLQLRTYETAVNTGWDRYNSLETKDNFILGRNLEWQAYAGLRLSSELTEGVQHELRLVGGLAYSKLFPNSLGKEANVRTDEFAPIIGLEYQLNLDFLHL
ncbi:MAG: hypothetical protein WCW67_07710 [Candidatus Margulisiibacteriota bacterium]|jgi:hypothetical protein